MANTATNRKAILAALGSTGSSQNETEFNKSFISAIKTGANTKAKVEIVALTASVVANATDLATAQALANDLKIKVNAIIAALKA